MTRLESTRSRSRSRASRSSSSSSSATAIDELSHSPATSTGVVSNEIYSVTLADILLFPLQIPRIITNYLFFISFIVYQLVVRILFTPSPPPRDKTDQKWRGRIAIVGAGLTGVSSAAHCVAHGFDVVIFESESEVGGIWQHVNDTSGLQLNSILYRFFPSIIWKDTFPKQKEIVDNIKIIWKQYDLESKTRFNTKVEKVHRHSDFSTSSREHGHGRWVINNGADGIFDAVIVTVGTTGTPKMVNLEGCEDYKKNGGKIVHSSQLDELEMDGKEVLILGSGASGVEAAELAVKKGAKKVKVLAHSDKWIIPRNIVFDIALSLNPFGRQTPFSWIWEYFLRVFHYRDLWHLSPVDKKIFESTPIVNDTFLTDIRAGKVTYIRGDAVRMNSTGMQFHIRQRGEPSTKESKILEDKSKTLQADIVIMATGYNRPSIDFLPQDLFPENKRDGIDYHRPNLYLQNFATEDWSVLLTNSSYQDAVGTVGNYHIGIYTRVLLSEF